MDYSPLIMALVIIFMLFLPMIIGKILTFIITIYYRNHRYNVSNYKYTAKEVLDEYIYKHHLSTQVRLRKGFLTDCYNVDTDYIYLSESVYNHRSLLAVSIALHEMSHMILFKNGEWNHRASAVLSPFNNFFAKALMVSACFIFIFHWTHPIFCVIFVISIIIYIVTMISVIQRERLASMHALLMMKDMEADLQDIHKANVLLRCCWLTYLFQFISTLAIVFFFMLGGRIDKVK